MNRFIRMVFCACIATCFLALVGCASGAKTPGQANTAEILFGNNVQQYLAQRQAHLSSLKSKMVSLDESTVELLGNLHAIDQELAAVQSKADDSNAQIDALRAEVETKKRALEQNLARAESLKKQVDMASSETERINLNQKADKARIATLFAEASKLEAHTAVLNRSITRTLNLKAEQLLREGS